MKILSFTSFALLCVSFTRAENANDIEDRVSSLEREFRGFKSAVMLPMRKFRKQIKREMKNKVLPKVLQAVNETVDIMCGVQVEDKIEHLFKDQDSVPSAVFRELQSRMNLLEEENEALKLTLEAFKLEMSSDMRVLLQTVKLKCNCEASGSPEHNSNSKQTPSLHTKDGSTNFHVPTGVYSQGSEGSVPQIGSRTVSFSPGEPTHSASMKDVTFNVSSAMPNFSNHASLLVVDDEGYMTRVSLLNASIHGLMKTENLIEGIAYDPGSKRIFWGANRPQQKAVYSVKLGGSGLRKLIDNKWVVSLAVDGKRRKVFLTDWSAKEIGVMSTTGRNFKVVTAYNEDGEPRNIALDIKKRMLYVSYTFSIIKMKYDGSKIKRLAEGLWMGPLALDSSNGILYFSFRDSIYKMALRGPVKTGQLVHRLHTDLSTLALYRNKLYVAFQNWALPLDVLDLKTNHLSHFAHVKSNSIVRLCIIPADQK